MQKGNWKKVLLAVLLTAMLIPVTVAATTKPVSASTKKVITQSTKKAKAGWVKQGNRWWYRYANGSYPKSQFKVIGGKTYYFDSKGWMRTGWQTIKKKAFYFDSSGAMQTGWKKIKNNWYYFKKAGSLGTKGKMCTGWLTDDGKRYYLQKSGAVGVKGKMLTGQRKIGNKNYYFDSSGALTNNGWQITGGNTYYYNANGKVKTGWQKINNKWYYFKKSGSAGAKGKMLTGWQTIDGNIYYLKKTGSMGVKGKMLTGWQKLNNNSFYFNSSGALLTGWQTISGKTYYLEPSGGYGTKGARVSGGNRDIDGKHCYFDENGVYTTHIYMVDPADNKRRAVEPQIKSDPQIGRDVSEDEFFAAVLYTEAGDQGLQGQVMVALTILNRVENSGFPNSLKFVIYSDGQFEVARDGALTTWLQRIRDNDPKVSYLTKYHSVAAVKQARAIWANYKKTGKRTISGINLPNGKNDFDYLFFMTHSAFTRLGLNKSKCDTFVYNGHTFFKKWVR